VITKVNVDTKVKEEIKTEFKDARFTCCDYSYNGKFLVTGGDDYKVRFWDDETTTMIVESDSFYTKHNAHSNRVFCSKFLPNDENVAVTAGWDMNIILHDQRQQGPVGALYGPLVVGEGLTFWGEN